MKKRTYLLTTILALYLYLLFTVFLPAFAASTKALITYDPAIPNFTSGSQNVVTALIHPANGAISAATLVFQSTGGVKIVKILGTLSSDNTLISNTKFIQEDMSDTSNKVTILFMRASVDLPTSIKIPVVITGSKAGNLQLDTKESQITDEKGNTYTLSQQKSSYITFSGNGKNSLPPPTPTPLSGSTVAVTVAMKFQGIKPADVKTKTISGVKVQLAQGSGNTTQYSLPQFITVSMDESGVWRGSAVFPNTKPGKNYAILIKGPKHLQKRICENNATESTEGSYRCGDGKIEITGNNVDINATGVMQMAGDIGIQDGILNGYDLSFIQNTIRKTARNAQSDADVNYDGKTNKTDYDVLIYTFVQTRGQDQQ